MISSISHAATTTAVTIASACRSRQASFLSCLDSIAYACIRYPLSKEQSAFYTTAYDVLLVMKISRIMFDAACIYISEEQSLEYAIGRAVRLHITNQVYSAVENLSLLVDYIAQKLIPFIPLMQDHFLYVIRYFVDLICVAIDCALLPFITFSCVKDAFITPVDGFFAIAKKIFKLAYCFLSITYVFFQKTGCIAIAEGLLDFTVFIEESIKGNSVFVSLNLILFTMAGIDSFFTSSDVADLFTYFKKEINQLMGINKGICLSVGAALLKKMDKNSSAYNEVLANSPLRIRNKAAFDYVFKCIDSIKKGEALPPVKVGKYSCVLWAMFLEKEIGNVFDLHTQWTSNPELNYYLREVRDTSNQGNWFDNEAEAVEVIKKFPFLIIFCSVEVLSSVNNHVFTTTRGDMSCTILGYIEHLVKTYQANEMLLRVAPALFFKCFTLRDNQQVYDSLMRVLISLVQTQRYKTNNLNDFIKYAEENSRSRRLLVLHRLSKKNANRESR